MTHAAPITDANPTVAEMEARVARFRALQATDDYVVTAIPGCERTTCRVLGVPPAAPLAAEDFHLNIARSEAGKSAPGLAGGCDPGYINWPTELRAAALAVGVTLP
jgi:hypothetical protein